MVDIIAGLRRFRCVCQWYRQNWDVVLWYISIVKRCPYCDHHYKTEEMCLPHQNLYNLMHEEIKWYVRNKKAGRI